MKKGGWMKRDMLDMCVQLGKMMKRRKGNHENEERSRRKKKDEEEYDGWCLLCWIMMVHMWIIANRHLGRRHPTNQRKILISERRV